MKPNPLPCQSREAGGALLMTTILSAAALAILTGAMAWSATNTRMTDRSNRYTQAVAAAESATEKEISQISRDFVSGGEALILANLNAYRHTVPNSSDSTFWADWEFNDASGNTGQSYVDFGASSNYTALGSAFASLQGFVSTATLVSNARQPRALQNVVGGVMQQLKLARVPIYQFLMYSSGDMAISCGQPFNATGRIHSNAQLYMEPDNTLKCLSTVTSVGDILFQREPLDTRTPPSGTVHYDIDPTSHVPPLNLPIGTSNSPIAVREITQPPPIGEDPNSQLGRLRFYNLADMLVLVSNTTVKVTSGAFNGFSVPVPTNQWPLFVSTNSSFWDEREAKNVRAVDINVGILTAWSATNNNVRSALGSRDVSSVYVLDRRTLPATDLKGVRVVNGRRLPPRGLTIATSSPMYVFGHYNQPTDASLASPDTSTTMPASLAGDAITVLSVGWLDANSKLVLTKRGASPTTVNAAFLAGAVDTTLGHYGGGMENFPRFLESWGSGNEFTYNGSMCKLFPSLYATNAWGKTNVYDPPKRGWNYDTNFDNQAKLPPLTPGAQTVTRFFFATLAPNKTAKPTSP